MGFREQEAMYSRNWRGGWTAGRTCKVGVHSAEFRSDSDCVGKLLVTIEYRVTIGK